MVDRVGFIGLGNMGRPMATVLATKGFPLTVHDLSPERMEVLRQRGAAISADVAGVIANCDVLVTMLPNTPDVQGVVHGPGGLIAAGRPGMLHIDMSTIDPVASRAIAAALEAKGIAFVDAAVGRSPAHAERGESMFMVGATDDGLARARPLLDAMGTLPLRCVPAWPEMPVETVEMVVT